MDGAVMFYTMCSNVGRAAGSGTLRTRGHVTVSNCGTFSPLLLIDSGTAIASGVYSGSLEIRTGAALTVTNQTVYGSASVSGTLTGANISSIFNFAGDVFATAPWYCPLHHRSGQTDREGVFRPPQANVQVN
jgi:hypothetical protein